MSDDLWFTTLRWTRGAGVAKLRGRVAILATKPAIGCDFDELVYRPEIALARVRLAGGGTRELRPDEIAACDRILKAHHDAA